MEELKGKCLGLLLLFILAIATTVKEASAAKHVVGGSNGWDESTDYDSWSKRQTFKVGDTLEFKYTTGLHNVVELGSESEYKSCDTSNAANSMSTGDDVVKLNKVGTRYFTCGTDGHCTAGMKLKVNVVAASGPSPSPSPSPSSSQSAPSSSPSSESSSSSPSSLGSSSSSSSSGSSSSSSPSSSSASSNLNIWSRSRNLFYSFLLMVSFSPFVAFFHTLMI